MAIKRFRVRDAEGNLPLFKADTTQKCYDYLLTVNSVNKNFTVEDVEDDIDWITADEFIEAFKEGECPMDLQFF
jgi:hypothetical protein